MNKRKLNLANNPLLSGPAFGDRDRIGTPYRDLDLLLIDKDPNQPRRVFDEEKLKELADSIRTYGVLSPILVRPSKTPGRYDLIAGERRLRASQLAGLKTVPAMIEQSGSEETERTMAIQLVENLQRADLTPLERAHAIGALQEQFSLSVREIAERLGVSKSMVQRSLDILTLPDDLLNALRNGASESKVLLLAKIDEPEVRAAYLKDLDTLTRGQLEKDITTRSKDLDESNGVKSPEDDRITDELRRALGLKVRLVRSSATPEQGRLVVDFYSEHDLKELFRKLVAE